MFQTAVDIESLSKHATARWKRKSVSTADPSISSSDTKRLHSLILTSKPENFLNIPSTTKNPSSKVSKTEDLPEISAELGSLRKKHDFNRGSNIYHEKNLSNLQKELENYKLEELKAKSHLTRLRNEVERLENSIQDTVKRQEDALETRKVYNHIIERMKVHKLRQEIKGEDYKSVLKTNKRVLEEELEYKRKSKESKNKTKKALELLEKYVEEEILDKECKLESVENDVKRKLEINSKREERFRRQIDIAERAANEDRELSATQMREDVMLMKFFYTIVGKKLDYDIKKQSYIEEAFEKVRKKSSINNVDEMVTKVLTSEIAFGELKRLVESFNLNIQQTQLKIEEIEQKLKKTEEIRTQSGLKETLQKQISEKTKLVLNSQQKLMKFKGIKQKIFLWSGKIMDKLGCSNTPNNLNSRLQEIHQTIKSQLNISKSVRIT